MRRNRIISRLLECENSDVVRIRRIRLEIPLDTQKYKRCMVFSDGNRTAVDSRRETMIGRF